MRKTLFIFFLTIYTALGFAQTYDRECYYGITFEISTNKNWGYGELVITAIEPNSPAEAAGIKVNDIIMEIDGKATYLRDNVTIAKWLFDNPNPAVNFTIRNVNTYFKEYTLNRGCITVNSIDEYTLSNFFSFYSLEDSRNQTFILPLEVNPTKDVDYTDYHTYAFYNDKLEITDLDNKLRAILEKNLYKKGFKLDINSPDIWIQIHYQYNTNPQFSKPQESSSNSKTSYRYNTKTEKMEQLPIIPVSVKDRETKGQYMSNLGIVFFDKKNIDSLQYTKIWECNITDYLSSNMSLQKYSELHIPLIMMQYPYKESKKEAQYTVEFSKYNYTGIYFNTDTMNIINDVDFDSPAFSSGLRAGYKINKLNNQKTDYTRSEISESYQKFVEETLNYRDSTYRFVGADGYKDYMFWNPVYYSEIAKQFRNKKYITSFAYLYEFNKYINPNYNETINIEAWDGIQRRIFTVRPQIKESIIIKAL